MSSSRKDSKKYHGITTIRTTIKQSKEAGRCYVMATVMEVNSKSNNTITFIFRLILSYGRLYLLAMFFHNSATVLLQRRL